MDTTLEGQCPHQLRCTNCVIDYDKDHEHTADSRRCPTRLSKYGTACDNERKAQKNRKPMDQGKTEEVGNGTGKPAGTPMLTHTLTHPSTQPIYPWVSHMGCNGL